MALLNPFVFALEEEMEIRGFSCHIYTNFGPVLQFLCWKDFWCCCFISGESKLGRRAHRCRSSLLVPTLFTMNQPLPFYGPSRPLCVTVRDVQSLRTSLRCHGGAAVPHAPQPASSRNSAFKVTFSTSLVVTSTEETTFHGKVVFA